MAFNDILGNKKAKDLLEKTIKNKRVPSAYLFSGPSGIGKKKFASSLAKALNCKASETYCNECDICNKIDQEISEHITFVESEKNIIKVDKIRELQNSLKYKVVDFSKIIVIDDAHLLNPAAQNCLLKTLEEPGKNIYIVLVTSEPSSLLATVLSRCVRVNFAPLSDADVVDFLKEEEAVEEGKAGKIASIAEGSLSKALLFLDDEKMEERENFLQTIQSLQSGNREDILNLCQSLSRDEEKTINFLDTLKTTLRNRAQRLAGVSTKENDMWNIDSMNTYEDIFDNYMITQEARKNILPPRYANKQLTLETLLFKVFS